MARTTGNILNGFDSSLTLDRYQEIMHLPIAAFNGLNKPDEEPVYQCATIWKQSQRNELAQYLASAEERREAELGFPLAPKYMVDEEHPFAQAIVLDKKHLIQVGVSASSDISLAEALTHRDGSDNIIDPVVISVATTVTSTSEICVFYPDEDVKIRPSSISISGGTATIQIPRSRLVDPDLLDDRADHLMYDNDDNFLTTVDIKRCYNSIATATTLVWTSMQLAYLGIVVPVGCTERTQTACTTVEGSRAYRISKVRAFPASFSGETPTGAYYTYGCYPAIVRVSYQAGLQVSPNNELLTARYAHTLMAAQPCSCPLVVQYWQEDRKNADFVSPYGSTKGAQDAWMADSRMKVGIGGEF